MTFFISKWGPLNQFANTYFYNDALQFNQINKSKNLLKAITRGKCTSQMFLRLKSDIMGDRNENRNEFQTERSFVPTQK